MRPRRSFPATVISSRFVWICLPFVLAGSICLGAATYFSWLEWQYHAEVGKIEGTVLEKWRGAGSSTSFGGTSSSRGFGSGGGGVYYTVRYEYRTPGGSAWKSSDDVSHSYWDKFQPGDSIQVYYLPNHPSHSRLWTGVRLAWPVILFLVGAPMTLMGVVGEFVIVADLRRKYLKKHPHALQDAGQPDTGLTSR